MCVCVCVCVCVQCSSTSSSFSSSSSSVSSSFSSSSPPAPLLLSIQYPQSRPKGSSGRGAGVILSDSLRKIKAAGEANAKPSFEELLAKDISSGTCPRDGKSAAKGPAQPDEETDICGAFESIIDIYIYLFLVLKFISHSLSLF